MPDQAAPHLLLGKKEILVWIQARKQVVLLDQDGETGQGGAGYNTNAKAYFMGGGNSTMAVATATVSGGVVTKFEFSNDGCWIMIIIEVLAILTHRRLLLLLVDGDWLMLPIQMMIIKDSKILDATEGFVITRKRNESNTYLFQT